jgi:hypothetical protein
VLRLFISTVTVTFPSPRLGKCIDATDWHLPFLQVPLALLGKAFFPITNSDTKY